MSNRFWDAHMIIQGACNPSGVARALVSAIDQAREECADTDSVSRDPACRLITYQLAFLMGMEPLSSPYAADAYAPDMALCQKIANLELTEAQFSRLRERWQTCALGTEVSFPEFLSQAYVVLGTRTEAGWAIAVPWGGMHLCVEPDGHAHT